MSTTTDLQINNKNFKKLMKEERSGILEKQKLDYFRNNKNNNEFNNNYFVVGENIYDIQEQKRLLEEFERKKKNEKEKVKDFYIGNEQSIFQSNQNRNNFILDEKTVNKNRLIICNIQNIFDDDNGEDEFNMNDFNWENNNISQNSFSINIENKIQNNTNININQINNNVSKDHNKEVINQFFDFTQSQINKNNLNSNYQNVNGIQNNKYDDDFNPFLD